MLSWADYSYTHYLDSLAAELRAQHYSVRFLPFLYPCNFLPLAANATDMEPVRIDEDADFVLGQLMANNPELNVLARLIPDTGREFTSQPVHMSTIFGTGQRPHLLYKPKLFKKQSVLQVELQDLTTVPNNIRLTFGGVKVITRPLG